MAERTGLPSAWLPGVVLGCEGAGLGRAISCVTLEVGLGSAGLAMASDGRALPWGWLALAVHLRVPIVIGVGVNVVFPPSLSLSGLC